MSLTKRLVLKSNTGRSRVTIVFIVLVAIASTMLSVVSVRAADNVQQSVFAAHEKRRLATLSGDAEVVGSLMTDDLTFTHANAIVETKAQFVGALKTGRLRYKSVIDKDLQVRVHGETGIVSGTCRLVVNASGNDIDIHVRFTELWVKKNSTWQMALWHATQVP